ncbi:hypothetical protein FSB08_39075 [Paraburkholderia sp. JPY432]|uniref:hypothetical protein n=1 Tax=Paraburkholderia youngii TaxID=2782701 RepID=UPI001595DB67|nr:hypothetical protein [Paraburkholderia youngii]NVH78258.1 hypothetical protein [Paraburkholderia youngii]
MQTYLADFLATHDQHRIACDCSPVRRTVKREERLRTTVDLIVAGRHPNALAPRLIGLIAGGRFRSQPRQLRPSPAAPRQQHHVVGRVHMVMFEKHIFVQRENGIEAGKERSQLAIDVLLKLDIGEVKEPTVHVVKHSRHGSLKRLKVRTAVRRIIAVRELQFGKCIFETASRLMAP